MNMLSYFAIHYILSATGTPPVNPWSLLFFGLLVIAIGITSIVYPQLFWYLRIGRKLKEGSPSRLYLVVLRFGGVLNVAVGAVIIYYAWMFF